MSWDRDRLTHLKTAILNAFLRQSYPGDDNIVDKDFDEYQEVRQGLKGRLWQNLPDDVIRRGHWWLPLLSSSGFRYYLPAYLTYSLRSIENLDLVLESTLFSLTVGPGFSARVRDLTEPQCSAIRQFLEFVKDLDDPACSEGAEEALRGHWGGY